MINKQEIKEKLLQMENKDVTDAQSNYDEFVSVSESVINTDEVIDVDDTAHHWADTELSQTLDHQIHIHNKHLEDLKKTPFDPTSTVKPGAIVKINNGYFIIAVPIKKFTFNGKSFIGISPKAPIYEAIKGKEAGEEYEFNGKKMKIQEVY